MTTMKSATGALLLLVLLLVLSCCGVHSLSSPNKKVAVIGATGRLGRQVVEQLAARNIPCKLLVRNYNGKAATVTSLTKDSSKADVIAYLASLPNVDEIIDGDVSDTAALETLLEDCTACLAVYGATRMSKISDLWTNPSENEPSHAKSVNCQGVANIIAAATATNGCKRIVRITGKGETPNSFISILINLLGGMAKAWNYEGERLLRKSGAAGDIEYTIVRPGIMSEEGPKDDNYSLVLADNGGELKVAAIKYADVATLCIDCLDYPNAARSTLTVMTTEADGDAPIKSYDSLLSTVQPDRREFPSDMLQQHQQAVRKAIAGLGVASLVFLSIVARIIAGFFSS